MLILESDRLIKQLIVEWLHMAGYEAVCARDPVSAARVAAVGCDLVLADVSAPIESAREALARVTRTVPGTPIIAMSADVVVSGPLASQVIARGLGAAFVLAKPFTRDTLLKAIHKVRT